MRSAREAMIVSRVLPFFRIEGFRLRWTHFCKTLLATTDARSPHWNGIQACEILLHLSGALEQIFDYSWNLRWFEVLRWRGILTWIASEEFVLLVLNCLFRVVL